MFRCIILVIMALFISACGKKDASYYRLHPKQLQQALLNCPGNPSKNIDCQALMAIDNELSSLAYELRQDPQHFGTKIIALQTKLAQQCLVARNNPQNQDLHNQIKNTQKQLKQLFAIIRWLESPEG